MNPESCVFFEAKAYGKWSILVRSGISPEEGVKILSGDGKLHPDPALFTRVRSSGNARVYFSSCIYQDSPIDVYFKHYLFRSGLDFLKHLFRAGRGKRAFKASLMLHKYGFYAPEPLILMQKKLGPFAMENILVTVAVNGSMQLGARLKESGDTSNPEEFRRKRRIITEFGKVIGRMHALGIIHGDLRLSNVLVQSKKEIPCFFFIDNESTRKYHNIPAKLIKKNLVQINMHLTGVSNSDRMRFMKIYSRQRGLTPEESRALIKVVLEKTRMRMEKKALKNKKDHGGIN